MPEPRSVLSPVLLRTLLMLHCVCSVFLKAAHWADPCPTCAWCGLVSQARASPPGTGHSARVGQTEERKSSTWAESADFWLRSAARLSLHPTGLLRGGCHHLPATDRTESLGYQVQALGYAVSHFTQGLKFISPSALISSPDLICRSLFSELMQYLDKLLVCIIRTDFWLS